MKHWPVVIFALGSLAITGIAAWILKFLVDLGHAVRLPKDQP